MRTVARRTSNTTTRSPNESLSISKLSPRLNTLGRVTLSGRDTFDFPPRFSPRQRRLFLFCLNRRKNRGKKLHMIQSTSRLHAISPYCKKRAHGRALFYKKKYLLQLFTVAAHVISYCNVLCVVFLRSDTGAVFISKQP